MKIVRISDVNRENIISETVRVLKKGGIIIYPTETCYGVGVDATNPDAIKKLLQYKQRPEGKAISIAVCDEHMAREYVDANNTALHIYRTLLPGPVTVISQSIETPRRGVSTIAKGILAEDRSLGVRIPDYQLVRDIIRAFGKPITATSANRSGKKTPYSFDDIAAHQPKKKLDLIDLVLDAGEIPHNPPSTVVDTRMNDERVLREGRVGLGNRTDKTNRTYTTNTSDETEHLGECLMREHMDGLQHMCVMFALQGDLGAGKTQLTKGIAKALGITDSISSPTFVLMKEYSMQAPISNSQTPDSKLYHIDTWRMQSGSELEALGFSDMLKKGNVVVIEWVEKVRGVIEKIQNQKDVRIVWVKIEGSGNIRKITVLY